ncbi:MAG: phage adsorption protein NrfB [Bdellovibrionaceae bacterium]|nr:phage adsorption protein NrfB [Pseudobdellovibrionaceae bacterium]
MEFLSLDTLLFSLTVVVLCVIIIFALDDLFIDLVALVCGLKPKKLSNQDLKNIHGEAQRRVAIMIANWHEDEIIERMIHGNIDRIDYHNYHIFLGVYPNDIKTLEAATRLSLTYLNVHVVVNTRLGPTSKGQLLNQIVHQILAFEYTKNILFDILLLQDSEDLIHPLALKLINFKMLENDFLQTPVFCLPCSWRDFTRGTYIDEFAESHTRNLLVRSYLGGGIPSAGVGTAMSRLFVAEMLKIQNYQLLNEDTLTEDYHLGILAHRLGYDSEFVCYYTQEQGEKDYIATREYFPSSIKSSVMQKSRWTLGICVQGYLNLKWSPLISYRKKFFENYFLWRDRRGLVNAPVLLSSYILTLFYFFHYLVLSTWPSFLQDYLWIDILFAWSLFFMLNRLFQRARLVQSVYGFEAILFILPRWFLGNYINTLASFKALRQSLSSLRTGEKPAWIKTEHELPSLFGLESAQEKRLSSDGPDRRAEVGL